MERISGIYQIKCIPNGKVYIGKGKNIANRWKEHLTALEKGTHTCTPLLKDYQKYGATNFEFSIKEIFDISEVPERQVDNELDKLEAKWGEEQEALDSSTGYNYLSRFRYEKRIKHSTLMLNKHRVEIGETLGSNCLAVYACILAHYDYGKHLVILLTGDVARETRLSEKTVKSCFELLEEEKYIKETEIMENGSTSPRFFIIRKSERENLESQRYEYYDPANTDTADDMLKQKLACLKEKNKRINDNYYKMRNFYTDRIARLKKDLNEQWDKEVVYYREIKRLTEENQKLKESLAPLEKES